MEFVYLCLLATACFIAFYINRRERMEFSSPEDKSAPSAVTPAATSTPHSNAASASTGNDSEDRKYAQRNNLWVCKYCETLNTCPEGYTPPVSEPAQPTAPQQPVKSALRGDLVSKIKPAGTQSSSKNVKLVCGACGKLQ